MKIKIGLSGGPCAGKSYTIDKIKEYGIPYIGFIEEQATKIYHELKDKNGGKDPDLKKIKMYFQKRIYDDQVKEENNIFKDSKIKIVLIDRTLGDGKSYVTDEEWESYATSGYGDYDVVFFFNTFDKNMYEKLSSNNDARKESWEESMILNEKNKRKYKENIWR